MPVFNSNVCLLIVKAFHHAVSSGRPWAPARYSFKCRSFRTHGSRIFRKFLLQTQNLDYPLQMAPTSLTHLSGETSGDLARTRASAAARVVSCLPHIQRLAFIGLSSVREDYSANHPSVSSSLTPIRFRLSISSVQTPLT